MDYNNQGLDLGSATSTPESTPVHFPSEMQADTLFTFMPLPEFFCLQSLRNP